jgi:aspartate 1-decarboxylase
MLVKALKGKIHRARVTQTKLDYPGSLGVDADILKAAGIRPYEEVLLANVNNGARVETYVVEAPAGSRDVIVLGAAAKMFSPKDIVIIMNFGYYTPDELDSIKSEIVVCDENNNIKSL